jgi:hypothetical protein
MAHFLQNIAALRAALLVAGLSTGLCAQTTLRSGVPVQFYLTANSAAILNGRNGYLIPVPADPVGLVVNAQITPPDSGVNIYVRCGSDVPGNGSAFDTMAGTGLNGTINQFLARPMGGTAENCYIALQVTQNPSMGRGVAGRLTATIQTIPQGTQVTVSSLAALYLAGQPGGLSWAISLRHPIRPRKFPSR